MKNRPLNFLLIQSDQQRYDSLGCYGNSLVKTPVIDTLAEEGTVFDYAFTPIPICGPARASLITGKRPSGHGIFFNKESGSPAGRNFAGKQITLAEILKNKGYRSTICGKWHVGTNLPPSDCGFEGVYYPGYGYPSSHPHYMEYLKNLGTDFSLSNEVYSKRKGGKGVLLSAIQEGPVEASVPFYLASQAIEAMQKAARKNEPFFVRCDFWGPHIPYIIPEHYAQMYDPESIPPWPNFEDTLQNKPAIQQSMKRYWGIEDLSWEEWSRLTALCYGYVSLIDDQVGRLLDTLKELGLEDSTAFFYTSDHGGTVGAHGLADKGPYLYDEVCRIPFLAKVPGFSGADRNSALVYNMDLMPTILELAGCNIPDDLDAASITPLLQEKEEAVRKDDNVFIEFHGHQVPYAQRMVRTRNAKYVFNAPDCDELYDLKKDPYELINCAHNPGYRELLEKMHILMYSRLQEYNDPLTRFFNGARFNRSKTI